MNIKNIFIIYYQLVKTIVNKSKIKSIIKNEGL